MVAATHLRVRGSFRAKPVGTALVGVANPNPSVFGYAGSHTHSEHFGVEITKGSIKKYRARAHYELIISASPAWL